MDTRKGSCFKKRNSVRYTHEAVVSKCFHRKYCALQTVSWWLFA